MAITLTFLLFAERISNLVGERGLLALERLMGLILTAIAVEMLLRGIEAFVRQLQARPSAPSLYSDTSIAAC